MRQIGYTLDGRTLCPRFCFFKLNGQDKDAAQILWSDGESHVCECGDELERAMFPEQKLAALYPCAQCGGTITQTCREFKCEGRRVQ